MSKEETAIVLDYLSRGYSSSYEGEAIVQAVGTNRFTLLELVPRSGRNLTLLKRLYIGPDERPDIKFIKGRLEYPKLTNTARSELPNVIETVVKESEPKFITFFNKAGSISMRKHSLELLPSIGKKHMQNILEEREDKEFDSFQDIATRVKLMPDPVRVVKERVIQELSDPTVKYYLFTQSPRREERRRR